MIKLTQTVKKGGCAAKIAAHELRDILARVSFPAPQANLLINGHHFDDAAIYKISDTQSLVKTLDFFTPIVDTPYLFGQIAAANAMSDVYAMGGVPKLALAILAFPLIDFDNAIIADLLQGATDKLKEANADLAGGHSIDDETLKFGLSVTGLVDNNKIWSNAGAQVGDVLILTKALGTGTLMASLKNGFLSSDKLNSSYASMSQLNNILAYLNNDDQEHIHAATDVTGFGLAGHSYQMAQASNVSCKISASLLPVLPHAIESLAAGSLTKAHRTNREYTEQHIALDPQLTTEHTQLFFDPQTSGGLLLSVTQAHGQKILEKIKKEFPQAHIIGQVNSKAAKDVVYEC